MAKAAGKLSVIIPARDEEDNIGPCLQALAGDACLGVETEVIVVDNGSRDATVERAKGLGARVHLCPGLSISGLRNYGASMAGGDILAFVDADVIVGAGWCASALPYFADRTVGCVGSTPRIPEGATWVEKAWNSQFAIRPEISERAWLASMNIFVRKDVFEAVGGFSESLETCEDVDFGYRMCQRGFRIIEDMRIAAVHVGEAKTLRQHFRKELWRGKGNLRGICEHGVLAKEIPSHVVPVLSVLSVFLLAFSIVTSEPLQALAAVALNVAFPAARSIHTAMRRRTLEGLAKIFMVWLVYANAKGASMIWELVAIARGKMSRCRGPQRMVAERHVRKL